MGLYCLISPGGAPGATTTALALTLEWRRPVLMVEADLGGRRVLPGFLADKLNGHPPGPGLLGLAVEVQHDPAQANAHLVDRCALALPGVRHAAVLHGIRDPRHGRQLSQAWGVLADVLADYGADVIADIGRIGDESPIPLLTRADLIVMVLRPTLVGVDAARPRIDALHELLPEVAAGNRRLGLCVIDDGSYTATEVGHNLRLPVLATLPFAPADARVLSDGARPRVSFRTSVLLRAARAFGQRLRRQVDQRAFAQEGMARPSAFGDGR